MSIKTAWTAAEERSYRISDLEQGDYFVFEEHRNYDPPTVFVIISITEAAIKQLLEMTIPLIRLKTMKKKILAVCVNSGMISIFAGDRKVIPVNASIHISRQEAGDLVDYVPSKKKAPKKGRTDAVVQDDDDDDYVED